MPTLMRSLATHDGTFHADEVTACALLLQYNLIDQNKITRTRDAALIDKAEYVCDVGGIFDASKKRFDHHQSGYVGTLSSAGMVLHYLSDQKIISAAEFHYYYSSLIQGVDAVDNGITPRMEGLCTFSGVIANMVPAPHDASAQEMDAAFFMAVDFVRGHLSRMMQRYHYQHGCKHLVEESMATSTDCLRFDKSIPWLQAFFELGGEGHPARFVIMPSGEHWKLRTIPPTLREPMKVRQPLPAKWAGLLTKDLESVSHIPGAIFCHKGRFISIWQSKEGAEKALNYVLKHKEST